MNNTRRKELTRIIERIESLYGDIEMVKEELQAVLDEEQECRDNLPESMQDGERAQMMDDVISNLEEAIYELENLDASEITQSIESAIGY